MKCLEKCWKDYQTKRVLTDLECLLPQKSQEQWGETCALAYDECNSLLFEHWWAEGQKEMPAAFYTVLYLRHLHIQYFDRLAPVMPAWLLVCTAINCSRSKAGCSIKMWWYKHFTVCCSGLPVHFAVLSLPAPLPHHLHRVPASLAPGAKHAR